jgi:dehydrogenase/reductase SDR family member 7B
MSGKTFQGKVVVITGGTSGIGLACASAFGLAGAHIVITGRDLVKLGQAQTNLENRKISVRSIQADVSLESDCEKLFTETINTYGRADILINNAGISMRALFAETDILVIRQLMETNFFGMVYATRFFINEITKNKGSIIAISSIAGFRGLPARTGYSASKFAMNGFMEALRTEMLHSGVHFLTACPGFTASNIRNVALNKNAEAQQESPRDESNMMPAETVANAILQATLKRKKFLVLTTQGKLTWWLSRIIPFFLDNMVFNVFLKEAKSPLQSK